MKPFLDDDFLLDTATAVDLYQSFAKPQPIIDTHCHLSLNPADNEVFATVLGSFQDGVTPGKIQLGGAWWFLDQHDGIVKQLDALSQMGLLARFVGMLTDSRSFLSYSRHDYFRRILCNLLGGDVEKGRLPHDRGLLGTLVTDICFHNAERYFQFS